MRIVIIGKEEPMTVAGVGVFVQRLKAYLRRQGHEVFELRFAKNKTSEEGVFEIPYILAGKRTIVWLPHLSSAGKIEKYLETIRPDVVYAAAGQSTVDFILPRICRKLRIPLVAVWHGDFSHSSKMYEQALKIPFYAYIRFCRQLDLLHVFSLAMKEFYVRHGVAAEKVLVLANGVDSELYCSGKSHFKEVEEISVGILFLGRLTSAKNPEMVIKSFLKIKASKKTKLVLVGDGEMREKLGKKYGGNKQIIFTGTVLDEKKKLDIIRACDIFVLPSKYEGMSLSLLEAMAVGLVCVVSDVGGNGLIVGEAGVVIPFQKLGEQLPETLQELVDNRDKRLRLGKLARERVKREFRQEDIFKQLGSRLVEISGKGS